MQPLVTTRPERTADEIAADTNAANKFFEKWDASKWGNHHFERDLDRRVELESRSGRLTACAAEGAIWAHNYESNRRNRGPQVRAKLRAERLTEPIATEETLDLDRGALRAYVARSTWEAMPARQLHPSTPEEIRRSRVAALDWWCHRSGGWALQHANRLERESNASFQLWRLTHPQGETTPAPLWPTPRLRRERKSRLRVSKRLSYQHVKGQIRPAAMSLDRALEIAMAVLPA